MDETRQGLVGFSQGGSEAHKLAAENDWISFTGSVEGYMTGKEQPLNRPISSLIINAKGDDVIPIGGTKSLTVPAILNAAVPLVGPALVGYGAIEGALATPAQTSDGFFSDLWSRTKAVVTGAAGGAASELADLTIAPILENFGLMDGTDNYIQPQAYAIKNYVQAIEPNTPTTVTNANSDTSETFRNTTTGAEVKAIQLGSGTHGWAGSVVDKDNIPGLGEPNETVNASDEMARAFLAHPLGH